MRDDARDHYVLAGEIRSPHLRLTGRPVRAVGEETVHEADVVADKNSKTQTEET